MILLSSFQDLRAVKLLCLSGSLDSQHEVMIKFGETLHKIMLTNFNDDDSDTASSGSWSTRTYWTRKCTENAHFLPFPPLGTMPPNKRIKFDSAEQSPPQSSSKEGAAPDNGTSPSPPVSPSNSRERNNTIQHSRDRQKLLSVIDDLICFIKSAWMFSRFSLPSFSFFSSSNMSCFHFVFDYTIHTLFNSFQDDRQIGHQEASYIQCIKCIKHTSAFNGRTLYMYDISRWFFEHLFVIFLKLFSKSKWPFPFAILCLPETISVNLIEMIMSLLMRMKVSVKPIPFSLAHFQCTN